MLTQYNFSGTDLNLGEMGDFLRLVFLVILVAIVKE